MTRPISRFPGSILCIALLVNCSDDPATTAPPPPPHPEETDTADRAALIAFYNATNGRTHWHEKENWNTAESIRQWQGVKTNSAGFVTELSLPNNNLSGPLPPQLGDLAQLRRLSLYGNKLTGPLPAELGKLTQLTLLDVYSNQLGGSIPPELGALARLDTLDLFSNDLSGPLPAELGNLGSLRMLRASSNELSGSIPPELGALANLRYLSFSQNDLTGEIPPELGQLSSIEFLSVSRNGLTGTIPGGLGGLATLEELYLYDNQLSGELPPELGNLAKLETLWIQDSGLSGPIPEEFGNLTALQHLRAANNELNGELPHGLGNLKALIRLELEGNAFSGYLPPAIGELRALQRLWLDGNHELTGLLPRSMLDLEYLGELSYGATRVCAQIDDEFQQWLRSVREGYRTDCDDEQVERLALVTVHDFTDGPSWANRNSWGTDAPLGDWHGVTTEGGRVVELSLNENGLDGPVPAEIINLTELRMVELEGNDLFGGLPHTFGQLSRLTELRVGDNERLEGALPFALRQLERLRVLDFNGTGLCASPSASFQAWMSGIPETAGATCENPEAVSLSMPIVYLTQSIQSRTGRVRLVANRDALLRVFLTAEDPRGFFEPVVVASFTRGGIEVHRAEMSRADDRIPAEADESDLTLSYNAVIPAAVIAPGVAMVVEVDPEGTVPFTPESRTRFPAEGADSLNVVEVPPMRLTVVPVVEAHEADTSIMEWTRGITGDSPQVGLLKYAFPFSEFTATTRATHVTSLDLTSDDGQWGLVLELEALRTSENGTGYYYGVAGSVNGRVRGRARTPGWTSIGKPWATELAHEVGHNVSLNHAPCGDPPNPDRGYPYRDGSIGVWGYDFRDGSLVSPDRRKDIMGYCYSQGWLSDFHFRRVIDYRNRVAGDVAKAALVAASASSDVLVLWGGVVGGEMRIEPAFSMLAAPQLPDGPGPYRIRGSGADRRELFSLDFVAGEDEFGNRYFFFAVPIEPDWADSLERITLTGPEGLVTVERDDERTITVVTERGTGRIRAMLRDWEGSLPTVLRDAVDLEVRTTRGLGEAVRSNFLP